MTLPNFPASEVQTFFKLVFLLNVYWNHHFGFFKQNDKKKLNSFSWQHDIWFVLEKTRFILNWKLGICKLVLQISLKARRIDMSKWILASERNMFLYSTKSLVNNDKTFRTLVFLLKEGTSKYFQTEMMLVEPLILKIVFRKKTSLVFKMPFAIVFSFTWILVCYQKLRYNFITNTICSLLWRFKRSGHLRIILL